MRATQQLSLVLARIAIRSSYALGLRQSRRVTRYWYKGISDFAREISPDLACMNYGYHTADYDTLWPELAAGEPEQYQKQLYHSTATSSSVVSFEETELLEVGSGRGGGLAFLAKTLNPRKAVGLELSGTAVEDCRRRYKHVTNLTFVEGDALSLPFGSNTFNLVVNVESSHCYPSFTRFLGEVHRVLKEEGQLALVDFRKKSEVDEFQQELAASPFLLREMEDITDAVVKALSLDSDRKEKLIAQSALPQFLKNGFRAFAGCEGSSTYNDFVQGKRRYFRCILEKRRELDQ